MENSTINIGDLAIIRNALDLAATRGAFRGAELTTVGTVFDKLQVFLSEFEAQVGAEEDGAEGSTETSEE